MPELVAKPITVRGIGGFRKSSTHPTVSGKVGAGLQIPGSCNCAGDLPDMARGFREIAPAGDRRAPLHGVVFDILIGSGRAWRRHRRKPSPGSVPAPSSIPGHPRRHRGPFRTHGGKALVNLVPAAAVKYASGPE